MGNFVPTSSWSCYVTNEFLSEVHEYKSTHIVQTIMVNRCQGGKLRTYITHNESIIIQHLIINADNLTPSILIKNQTALFSYTFFL